MSRIKHALCLAFTVFLTVHSALAQVEAPATAELPIPRLDAITQVDRQHRPSQDEVRSATFMVKPQPHRVSGDAYVIVTDHRDEGFLEPLRRLAKHHAGTILRVDDLAALGRDAAAREKLEADLRKANPRFVAIAPRWESFRENTILGLWQVLAALDADPEIDVLPGLLVARDAKTLTSLVDRSIQYRPRARPAVRPFVVAQVMDSSVLGMRSLQKAGIMRVLFDQYGCSTSSLVTRTFRARKPDAERSSKGPQWEVSAAAPRQFISTLPPGAKQSLDAASLVVLFGHGVPGMTCGLDVDAFRDVKMADKVVLCGSCFSLAPGKSDFPAMPQGPDGSEIRADREDFALRAIENGSVAVYAHMRLNSGFPNLYPVLRGWMDGETIGEAYQRQLNALADLTGLAPDEFVLKDAGDRQGAMRRNPLLCVVIGDPALEPMVKMTAGTKD
jgi:hypothetical protein